MSRPNSSVPHQCAEDGRDRRVGRSMWAGSWGAIQGANKAKITKTRTSTTPIVASRLCLAARRNEMAAVDKLEVYKHDVYEPRPLTLWARVVRLCPSTTALVH